MRFSRLEIRDLAKAWGAISVAFAIVLKDAVGGFFPSLLLAAITVGLGFLLHELAHKFMAQRYDYWAEFRSFDRMLLLAIAFSFLGFVFAAPGAVMFRGTIYHSAKVGKISVAGPIVNIILAILFWSVPGIFGAYGFQINAWLALFNMIPFGMFDGAKVLRWNKAVYAAVVLAALGLVVGGSI
ncbi:MAG TPA: peptidase M50 [Candidatus Nanoarchaeia archaeon]|nr:peptidase M50 [Candidatus Nanoarchaeia archaeon]